MPDIARQFRGLEDLLESQERQDRINFVGTDISPVIDVDPGTLRLGQLQTELVTITGPDTTLSFATAPAGFYRQYLRLALVHLDPAARTLRIQIVDTATPVNITVLLSNLRAQGLEVIAQGGPIVAPFFLRGEVLALAAPFTASMSAYFIELPFGAPQPKNF